MKHISINTVPNYCNEELIKYIDEDLVIVDSLRDIQKLGTLRVEMNIILMCTKGRCQADIFGTTKEIRANDVVAHSSSLIADNLLLSPDFECRIMGLSDRLLKGLLNANIEIWNRAIYIDKRNIFHLDDDKIKLCSAYFYLIGLKINEKDTPFRKKIVQSLLQSALYEICALMQNPSRETSPAMSQKELLFERFIQELSGTMPKPRSVQHYGDRLFVTPKYLSAVCKSVSGRTASEWINEYVEDDIRFLLKSSDKSIKEIAEMLEFPSISFFGKYVREHFGASPKRFRDQLKNN